MSENDPTDDEDVVDEEEHERAKDDSVVHQEEHERANELDGENAESDENVAESYDEAMGVRSNEPGRDDDDES